MAPSGLMTLSASSQSLQSVASVSSGGPGDGDKIRLRFSYGGRIEQGVDGAYKYHGGQQYLDSLPREWSYADLMFRLSEKMQHAVAVKYQLPGEDLDPDALISVTDNSDLQEMFDEYMRALSMPGTPVKTFRLRVFLFRAQEDVYMPEKLQALSRGSSQRDLQISSGGGSQRLPSEPRYSENDDEVAELRSELNVGKRVSWSSFGSTTSSASLQSAVSKSSQKPPVLPTRPVAPKDAVAAWEDGFRAGQEASYFAEECMWEEVLMKKLNRATKYCSFSELCGPEEEAEDAAAAASGNELSADAQEWFDTQAAGEADTVMADAHRRPMLSVRDRAPGDAPHAAPATDREALYSQPEEEEEEEGVGGGWEACQAPYLPNLGSDFGVVTESEEAAPKARVKLPSQLGSDLGDDQSHVRVTPRPGQLGNGHNGYGKPPTPPRPGYLLPGAGPGVTRLGMADGAHGGGGHQQHTDHPVDQALEAAMHHHPHGSMDLYSPPSPGLNRQWSGSSSKSSHSVHYVPQEEVKVLCKIGEGAFGEVSLATAPIFGKVAVKWLKASKLGGRHSPAFWQEAELLGSLNHPNVIRFFGVVVESVAAQNVVGIITEYMSGGSLSALLHTPPGLQLPPVIPLRRRAELALGAVNGMAYLHELRIVHFDLKPDNLLVDGDLYTATNVKVADFGLSKHKYTSYVSGCKDLRGTLPYMAPELVSDPDHVSEKADVWSMGIVLWELVARQVPYVELSPQQIVSGLMSGCLRPEIPDWVEDEWRLLLESCLVVNPQHRPSFRELAARLERVRDEAAFLS
eukprot:jgi/Tetstr1/435012/TSEL_023983.t1